MKVKLGQLIGVLESGLLQKLVNDEFLPIATAWRFKRLWKAVLPELDEYNKTRMELLAKYGTLNEKTNQFEFLGKDGKRDSKKDAAFNTELGSLLGMDIELAGVLPFTIDDFAPRKFDAPTLPFSPANLLHLDWLIVENAGEVAALQLVNADTKDHMIECS